MYYGEIKKTDIANGPGVRVSLFVSGCTHHCPGCFNEDTWDFSFGMPFTEETEKEIIDAVSPDYIAGLSVLGGEPFEPDNQHRLLPLFQKIHALFPQKTIWVYTGYLFDRELTCDLPAGQALPAADDPDALLPGTGDNILQTDGTLRFVYRNTAGDLVRLPVPLRSAHCGVTGELLSLIEVVVDGKYIASEKDLSIRFRGSRNQRLIDVKASLEAGHPVPWN